MFSSETTIIKKATSHPLKYSLALLFLISALWLMPAPGFAMQFMDGKKADIAELTGKGRWTVFKIWVSSCHVCNETIHYMDELKTLSPDTDIFGISIDTEKSAAEAFIKRHELKFPNLSTSIDEMNNFLGSEAGETLLGTPTIMLYNRTGQLLAVQPGAVMAQDLAKFIKEQEKP